MRVDIDFEDSDENDYILRFDYIPERPSPHCINPDHPSYYDCGDPEEIEFEGIVINSDVDNDGTIKFLEKINISESELTDLVYGDIVREFDNQTKDCWF